MSHIFEEVEELIRAGTVLTIVERLQGCIVVHQGCGQDEEVEDLVRGTKVVESIREPTLRDT